MNLTQEKQVLRIEKIELADNLDLIVQDPWDVVQVIQDVYIVKNNKTVRLDRSYGYHGVVKIDLSRKNVEVNHKYGIARIGNVKSINIFKRQE